MPPRGGVKPSTNWPINLGGCHHIFVNTQSQSVCFAKCICLRLLNVFVSNSKCTKCICFKLQDVFVSNWPINLRGCHLIFVKTSESGRFCDVQQMAINHGPRAVASFSLTLCLHLGNKTNFCLFSNLKKHLFEKECCNGIV